MIHKIWRQSCIPAPYPHTHHTSCHLYSCCKHLKKKITLFPKKFYLRSVLHDLGIVEQINIISHAYLRLTILELLNILLGNCFPQLLFPSPKMMKYRSPIWKKCVCATFVPEFKTGEISEVPWGRGGGEVI